MKTSKIKFNFSDDFLNDSSSDDDDRSSRRKHVNLNPLQKKQCKLPVDGDSSSEDEFETEMNNELNAVMKKVEGQGTPSTTNVPTDIKTETTYYDKAYFDSDSDDEASSDVKKNTNHPVISNDDLLYDPEMDDEDQKWIDNQRRKYQPVKNKLDKHVAKLPNSDAVLNCPCCMILLCLDCQRHAVYNSQYRAMFVTNCKVIHDEILKYPLKNETPKTKKRKHNDELKVTSSMNVLEKLAEGNDDNEIYHPVHCTECNTEVAVFDKEEVFHFFNVLASHA